MNLQLFEKKIFSQNGEDGITIKLIELIYGKYCKFRNYVEFGVEDGSQCNTRILREKFGWKGLLMDGGYSNKNIFLKQEFITKENIVDLFKKYNVPYNINLLSVDIDGNDFYCLKEILNNYKCDIIICEYNATHLPHEDKVIVYDKDFRWGEHFSNYSYYSNYYGVSLLALKKLANKYNYSIVYCENNGVNCFMVHNDIISEKKLNFLNVNDITKIYKYPKYGLGPNGGHYKDNLNRNYVTFDEAINT